MPVTLYQSTDPSAPVLNGTAGEYVALLDACLRTGYGAKAGAGWTKPFTGTNKASFRQGGGNQFYLRVEDNFSSGSNRYAKLIGHEVMTTVDAGTGLFPTAVQSATGLEHFYNSGLVARPWIIVADDRTVYVLIDAAGTGLYRAVMFGDIYAAKGVTDAYRTMLIGPTTFSDTDVLASLTATVAGTTVGHYIARTHGGTGGSLLVGKHGDGVMSVSSVLKGPILYPDPVSGGIWLSPVYLHEIAEPTIRGKLRGFWHFLQETSGIGDRDTFNGATGSEFAGKTFIVINASQNTGALYIIETSNTWLTNS